jgi:hypothetical protein
MKTWRKYNGALVPLTPPHVDVDITDIDKKIKENNSYFARWTSNFDSKNESEFWYVIQDKIMVIEDYSKNTRSKIRRGLKQCEVKMTTKDILLENGYDCYSSAFSKYNTHLSPKTISQFQEEVNSFDDSWDFWGIYHDDVLIGYSQNKIIDDYCDYSTIKFHPDYLKIYPSYALFFTMNQYYLNEKNFKYVNDGARSISHETNIQSFLIDKFRFRKAYCKLHVIYSNRIKFLLHLLYPFRILLRYFKFGVLDKINILLFQEYIIRKQKNEK